MRMSLDGLRAWIGEVERKLGMRTRVFLALAVIAIGIGGAAIYLALDARSDAVSEADVRELQGELETRIGAADGGADADAEAVAQLESQVQALQAEVEQLSGGGGKGSNGNGSGGGSGGAGTGTDGAGEAQEKLQELLEPAKDQGAAGE